MLVAAGLVALSELSKRAFDKKHETVQASSLVIVVC